MPMKDASKAVPPLDDTSDADTSTSYYIPGTTSQSSDTAAAVIEEYSAIALKCTKHLVSTKPRLYLGVPKQCISIIELIQHYTLLSDIAIFITLQKIRLAQTFMELGDA
nr:unnamed protein product [Callosobruchus analis]